MRGLQIRINIKCYAKILRLGKSDKTLCELKLLEIYMSWPELFSVVCTRILKKFILFAVKVRVKMGVFKLGSEEINPLDVTPTKSRPPEKT